MNFFLYYGFCHCISERNPSFFIDNLYIDPEKPLRPEKIDRNTYYL